MKDSVRLLLFQQTLTGIVTKWYIELPCASQIPCSPFLEQELRTLPDADKHLRTFFVFDNYVINSLTIVYLLQDWSFNIHILATEHSHSYI